MAMDSLTRPPSLSGLAAHRQRLSGLRLNALFERDNDRQRRLQLEAAGIHLDFSKSYCDAALLQCFEHSALEAGLPDAVRCLFAGEPVNVTEGRAALHSALRASDGAPYRAEVEDVHRRMRAIVEAVHDGTLHGFDGQPITDVVNIGIGGSDLGPRMAVTALRGYWQPRVTCHFVANVDPCDISDTLADLDPARTLLVVCSKSFTTLETLENARAARAWLEQAAAGADISGQFVAVTASPDKAASFGVAEGQILPMWDWVGGRFSLWSAIGLPIALAVGWGHFQALLGGAEAMDRHYAEAPPATNMPMLLALLECWYLHCWDAHSVAVLPYSHRLRLFPAFLQQLSMESLGKSTGLDGRQVAWHTGPVIWGEAGTNGQHSFHQLLHQGTRLVPVDFIAVRGSETALETQHHDELMANFFAQPDALAVGKTEAELRAEGVPEHLLPHKSFPGNRPSNTLVLDELTPATLGALVALYEHKVHSQSILWGINAFDQWGVELGKQINTTIVKAMEEGRDDDFDPSTRALMRRYRGG